MLIHFRDAMNNRIINNCQIYESVIMHNTISHAFDLSPRQFFMICLK